MSVPETAAVSRSPAAAFLDPRGASGLIGPRHGTNPRPALRALRPTRLAGALENPPTPPHLARETVGHPAIEVTITIYTHLSLPEKPKALSKPAEAPG